MLEVREQFFRLIYSLTICQDPAVTDVACAALNGLKMGDKTLTVRRATAR
jgi:splicing factor U2AF subunit